MLYNGYNPDHLLLLIYDNRREFFITFSWSNVNEWLMVKYFMLWIILMLFLIQLNLKY